VIATYSTRKEGGAVGFAVSFVMARSGGRVETPFGLGGRFAFFPLGARAGGRHLHEGTFLPATLFIERITALEALAIVTHDVAVAVQIASALGAALEPQPH
jgi:hypothetical protein